jgi:hypothetical protein
MEPQQLSNYIISGYFDIKTIPDFDYWSSKSS